MKINRVNGVFSKNFMRSLQIEIINLTGDYHTAYSYPESNFERIQPKSFFIVRKTLPKSGTYWRKFGIPSNFC
jgi:hypothetical protein